MIKKIAILTSGGDAPGMNNAIIAIAKKAQENNIEAFLVFEGYKGLVENNIKPVTEYDIDKHATEGGTFIFTSRYPDFKKPDVREKAKQNLIDRGIDALIVIGGDGSYRGAQLLHEIDIKTMALPGTIDNDITSSDYTIGYDTALESIFQNVSRVKDTNKSHDRAAIIEIMGHGCGDLTLFSGIATGAQVIVTNENKMSAEEIGNIVKQQHEAGKRGIIVLVSEFIFEDLDAVAKKIEEISNVVTRSVILGHTQRGGSPTTIDRTRATQMGEFAVEKLINGDSGLAIGIINDKLTGTPILEALEIPRENRKELADKVNKQNQA